MKVWIVENKEGELVAASKDKLAAILSAIQHKYWEPWEGGSVEERLESRGYVLREVDIAALERVGEEKDDLWTEIVSLKARNAALERVAEAAREWRDMRTRLCPQSMDRVEKHWQRTQEAVAEVDAALDALDVAEAREQVARGETHTGDDLREALGVDERWEEG